MVYSPKSKPGFFHWLADPVKIFMGAGLLTIFGVLCFFLTDSMNPPPPKNIPVINTALPFGHRADGSVSGAASQSVVPEENPDDPVIPIEEFAVGKPFANHHSSKRLGVSS